MSDVVESFPGLLGARISSRGKRVARVLLSGVVWIAFSSGIVTGVVWLGEWWDVRQWTATVVLILGICAVASVVIVGLIAAVWTAIAGRNPVDRILGLRTVRAETGAKPTIAGFGRAILMGLMGLVTGGVVPLLFAIIARDSFGRAWQDRWSGLAVIDVRHGRDVTKNPPTPTEVREYLTPSRISQAGIVAVHPVLTVSSGSPVGGPQAVATPRLSGIHQPLPGVYSGFGSPVDIEPAQHPAQASDTRAWLLRFDTGQTYRLNGTALLGRDPGKQLAFPGAQLVRVEDPSRTVSSTHAAIGATDVGVWVQDMGSTNGSAIATKVGHVKAISAGTRVAVEAGGRVHLGDRVMRIEEVRG
ncbi:MAG: FHA domain-containing protein [Propionibacteriaceae bacterium]|nr:FHA domain-containing protein [Propionibacteriaceae bacterium]